MARLTKCVTGIIFAALGFYSAYILWVSQPFLSTVLAVNALSFAIEMFKNRTIQMYDYVAGAIAIAGFVYIFY